VDFDVHHGNGTEAIIRSDPRVLYCSTFQHPFYPHRGFDAVAGNIVSVPLRAGTDGPAFRAAVKAQWMPRLEDFKPQLILVSAGFDAHLEDGMAGLSLCEADFFWVTEEIRKIAECHAEGRIVSVLEGGYALPALGRSVAAHLNALLG
jgi:acetoin utilization deacetylase AcuC-like enzyme